jgi:hypothetical protein
MMLAARAVVKHSPQLKGLSIVSPDVLYLGYALQVEKQVQQLVILPIVIERKYRHPVLKLKGKA